MYDHDDGHDQGHDVDKVIGDLEDEGIRKFNCAGVAPCLYADTLVDLLVAHEGAQRYRRLFAYRLEVAEAHVCWL